MSKAVARSVAAAEAIAIVGADPDHAPAWGEDQKYTGVAIRQYARAMPDGRYVGESVYVPEKGFRYFPEDAYVELPISPRPHSWTLEAWFIWSEGDGPLIAADTDPWDWGWLFASDGKAAYRIGGQHRTTDVALSSIRGDHWIYVAVAKEGPRAVLWLNDGPADDWSGAPVLATLSDAVAMKHAVGFAGDLAYYDRRLPDDRLAAHWEAGKDRP